MRLCKFFVLLEPSSDEIKRLVISNGGAFHHYYSRTRVTHIIASNLPSSKISQIRDEKVVKPDWIVDRYLSSALFTGFNNVIVVGYSVVAAFCCFALQRTYCSRYKTFDSVQVTVDQRSSNKAFCSTNMDWVHDRISFMQRVASLKKAWLWVLVNLLGFLLWWCDQAAPNNQLLTSLQYLQNSCLSIQFSFHISCASVVHLLNW